MRGEKLKFSTIILFVSLFTSAAFAKVTLQNLRAEIQNFDLSGTPIDISSQKLASRAQRLDQMAQKSPEAKQLFFDLVHDYLSAHRVQEAIWLLQRANDVVDAETLKEKFQKFIETAPVLSQTELGGGTGAELLTLPGQIEVVMKRKTGLSDELNNPSAEAWVYNLSEALELNIVSMTILRKDKKGIYSVQSFIKGTTRGGQDFRSTAYTSEFQELYFLDYLIQNKDRNPNNWRYRLDGRIIAIDHSLSYGGKKGKEWLEYPDSAALESTDASSIKWSPKLKKALSMPDEVIRKRLSTSVPPEVLNFYLRKRRMLSKHIVVLKTCSTMAGQ